MKMSYDKETDSLTITLHDDDVNAIKCRMELRGGEKEGG